MGGTATVELCRALSSAVDCPAALDAALTMSAATSTAITFVSVALASYGRGARRLASSWSHASGAAFPACCAALRLCFVRYVGLQSRAECGQCRRRDGGAERDDESSVTCLGAGDRHRVDGERPGGGDRSARRGQA